MAFEGTLETFSIADILQLIGLQRKTGILTLKSKNEVVTVSFYNGMIISADSVPKKLEDKLGKVLVKTGIITAEQLEEVLSIQKKTLQKLGYILIKQGYLTQEQLKEALQVQISQMIYRLFRWTSGEYSFDPHAKVEYDPENMVPLSAESILMEGIQMIDEWPLIQKKIPSFNIVYRKVENINVQTKEAAAKQEQSEFDLLIEDSIKDYVSEEKIQLSKEEQLVYNLVDGQKTVQQIIESCPLTEFHTCKALFELHTRNIIEPIKEVVPAAEEESVAVQREKSSNMPLMIAFIIMVIISIGSIAVNINTPFGFFLENPYYIKSPQNFWDSYQKLIKNSEAIMIYYNKYNKLPLSLNDVVNAGIIAKEDIKDPWNREYKLEVGDDYYTLIGYDKNGKVLKELILTQFLPSLQRNAKTENKTKGEEIQIIQ